MGESKGRGRERGDRQIQTETNDAESEKCRERDRVPRTDSERVRQDRCVKGHRGTQGKRRQRREGGEVRCMEIWEADVTMANSKELPWWLRR